MKIDDFCFNVSTKCHNLKKTVGPEHKQRNLSSNSNISAEKVEAPEEMDCNVGTIGHVDHEKTTFTSVIYNGFGKKRLNLVHFI